ncbi:ABC transporter permease subunit [Planotetraspora kaengkrachanensis]|uniref:ABC transporter permease n=1 Tax=Planotetraspora kaengkrachanensis TaxID=575193 RepID=A0A8J3LX79_9ACTN|nr:ABC transporter permease subunit [Planotetraspora kaengkrachanensis]GIG79514.1 ABC transporter permease [Planotetraspora kaengkrachanensis]
MTQTAPPRNAPAETAVAGVTSVMDVVAAEWLKLRTMRSTWAVWAGAAACTLIGLVVIMSHVASYDQATPQEQASFESADPAVAVMPLVAFFIGSLGVLAITSEYSTGSIAPSLVVVPQRRLLLAAKTVVVACVALAGGVLFAGLSQIGAMLILGDRPAPLNPWAHWWESVPSAAGTAVTTLATGLVALGLGVVLRSAAATTAVMGALTLVVPMFAHMLPEPVHLWVASVLIPNLAPQIAGQESAYLLSPPAAIAVLTVYVVVALGAASLSFSRRDS